MSSNEDIDLIPLDDERVNLLDIKRARERLLNLLEDRVRKEQFTQRLEEKLHAITSDLD